MKNFKIQSYIGAAAMSLLVLASSCNKDFDKVIPDAPENSTNVDFKAPKVLYIIADGARGSSVREAPAERIKALLGNAIYSWNSLGDVTETNSTNWADMMTGVRKEKHNILTEDFADNKLAEYPVIFERIKSVNPKLRIASFASSTAFKEKLTAGADVSEVFPGDDEGVKNRMVTFLKDDTASIVVGEFSGIQAAGMASGFDNTFPQYKSAIADFDKRVGELVDAVRARTNYVNENWLIVVTSSRGGVFALPPDQDDKTIFSNTNANTFTIFHNASYKPTFIGKPFLGSSYAGKAIRFRGDPERSQGFVDAGLSNSFNFNGKDFTVSVKIKKSSPKDTGGGQYWYEWPSILGKRGDLHWGGDNAPGNPGWDICLFYNGWRVFEQGGTGNINGQEIAGLDFSGETWHDLTFVIETKADGNKYIRLYTDGVKGITNKNGANNAAPYKEDWLIPGQPDLDNDAPMRVGFQTGEQNGGKGYINVQLAELKIWAKALSESTIQAYACDATMDESHPDYPYLVGYWPMNEGSGATLKDMGVLGADFTMQGTYEWEDFNSLICSPNNTNLSTLVPKNSDIPTQMLSWFNIARQESWGLDGRVWISN